MPLTKAVLCGNLEVVRFLLESGYTPEQTGLGREETLTRPVKVP